MLLERNLKSFAARGRDFLHGTVDRADLRQGAVGELEDKIGGGNLVGGCVLHDTNQTGTIDADLDHLHVGRRREFDVPIDVGQQLSGNLGCGKFLDRFELGWPDEFGPQHDTQSQHYKRQYDQAPGPEFLGGGPIGEI